MKEIYKMKSMWTLKNDLNAIKRKLELGKVFYDKHISEIDKYREACKMILDIIKTEPQLSLSERSAAQIGYTNVIEDKTGNIDHYFISDDRLIKFLTATTIMANFLEENGKTLDEIIDEGKKKVINSDQETVTKVILVPNGLHSFSRQAKTRTKSTAQILNELEAQYLLLEKLMRKMEVDILGIKKKVEEALNTVKDEKNINNTNNSIDL